MSIRNVLYTGLILGTFALPTIAQADMDVDVTTAPPAPQTEAVPEARTGYVWSPGYWSWNMDLNRHEWVKGHWVEDHAGAHWIPDKWTQDPDHPGHWHFRSGHWES